MASHRLSVTPPFSGVPIRVESEEMDIDFNSLSLGSTKIPVREIGVPGGGYAVEVGSRLVISDAVESNEAVTLSQLNSVPRILPKSERIVLTQDHLDAEGFVLTQVPYDPESIVLFPLGAGPQSYDDDFEVTIADGGKRVSWSNKGLSHMGLEIGTVIRVVYNYQV